MLSTSAATTSSSSSFVPSLVLTCHPGLGVSAYIVWFATVFLAYQAMTHILLNAVDALGPGALICINGPALLVWMLIILSYVLCLCHGWGFMFESQCRSGDIWSGPCGAMRAGMAQIAILSLAMYTGLKMCIASIANQDAGYRRYGQCPWASSIAASDLKRITW